jgi:hypothetical protein
MPEKLWAVLYDLFSSTCQAFCERALTRPGELALYISRKRYPFLAKPVSKEQESKQEVQDG